MFGYFSSKPPIFKHEIQTTKRTRRLSTVRSCNMIGYICAKMSLSASCIQYSYTKYVKRKCFHRKLFGAILALFSYQANIQSNFVITVCLKSQKKIFSFLLRKNYFIFLKGFLKMRNHFSLKTFVFFFINNMNFVFSDHQVAYCFLSKRNKRRRAYRLTKVKFLIFKKRIEKEFFVLF